MPLILHIHKCIQFCHVICFCIGKSLKSMKAYNEIFDIKRDVSFIINNMQYKFKMEQDPVGPPRYKSFLLVPTTPPLFLVFRKYASFSLLDPP